MTRYKRPFYAVVLVVAIAVLVSEVMKQKLQTVNLPPGTVIPSGSVFSAKIEDGLLLKVYKLRGIKPENCSLNYTSQLDVVSKRNILRIVSIQCGSTHRELEGFALGSDGATGLRVNPKNKQVTKEDEIFSVVVTKTLSLQGMSLEYYGSNSKIQF